MFKIELFLLESYVDRVHSDNSEIRHILNYKHKKNRYKYVCSWTGVPGERSVVLEINATYPSIWAGDVRKIPISSDDTGITPLFVKNFGLDLYQKIKRAFNNRNFLSDEENSFNKRSIANFVGENIILSQTLAHPFVKIVCNDLEFRAFFVRESDLQIPVPMPLSLPFKSIFVGERVLNENY